MPESNYEGDPDYPDELDITVGFSFSRVGDRIRMECVGDMSDWSEWQEFILSDMPEGRYLPFPFGISPYSSRRGIDEARRTEKQNVNIAVAVLMLDSNIGHIPNPVTTPTNDMSAFPDTTSVAGSADKLNDPSGTAYTTGDKNGYILWDHDNTADGGVISLERYTNVRTTAYYYTVEGDGTVHQWSAPGGVEYID